MVFLLILEKKIMKALIQRVKCAKVEVNGQIVGQIDGGILVYLGIGKGDDLAMGQKLLDKIIAYRIFENTTDPDKLGKLDKSLNDVGGGLLIVSQFTLMANTKNGLRPDFSPALPPSDAKVLFDEIVQYAKTKIANTQTGQFGADMQVSAINDGPINFLLEMSGVWALNGFLSGWLLVFALNLAHIGQKFVAMF